MSLKYTNKSFQQKYWAERKNSRKYNHPVVQAFVHQRIDWLKGQLEFEKN